VDHDSNIVERIGQLLGRQRSTVDKIANYGMVDAELNVFFVVPSGCRDVEFEYA
jgi:hypothetical protein